MSSFVKRKANKQWLWLALDGETRPVSAFYGGARSRQSARQLWNRIPREYGEQASFATDAWEADKGIIATAQHGVDAKGSGLTNVIERFNSRLRPRVAGLVRARLSFSKHLGNHIGAIKYFICHYNLKVTGRA